TSRTFKVIAPSPRNDCQSLPPERILPRSRSPSKRPPAISPMRRSWPGVAPITLGGFTSIWNMNRGWYRSAVISGGSITVKEFVVIADLQRIGSHFCYVLLHTHQRTSKVSGKSSQTHSWSIYCIDRRDYCSRITR